jgi:predicted metal-dependent hydrolase
VNEHGTIEYGGRRIGFDVVRTDRKRLIVTVEPDLSVHVTAPADKSLADIEGRLRRRGAWLVRQLEEFERFLPKQPPRRYLSGESHRYLGRQYRLKVEKATAEPGVKLKGAHLHVRATSPDDAAEVKRLLDDWYRQRGRERFQACVDGAIARHGHLGLKANGVRLQAMKRRWGSYTKSGTILLNPELVKAPTVCIEYVIVHELCHARFLNHGRKFEALLTRCLPDWRERKVRLETTLHG